MASMQVPRKSVRAMTTPDSLAQRLLGLREVQAGFAFGVPSDAEDQYLAAISRIAREHIEGPIRALHSPGEQYVEPNGGATLTRCEGCDDDWPCATIRALGGTDG